MTLNEIFRRSGEPTYYTPMAVVGQLVNQEGGTVVIGNPPFSATQEKPKKKNWIKKWRMFGLYFAVANCRLKRRDWRDTQMRQYDGGWRGYRKDKEDVFEAQGHKCPHCGLEVQSFKDLEAHHILPCGRFPEMRNKKENIIMLCHHCHREVHNNPYKNIEMMEAKAKELGIDLNEHYETGNIRDCEAEAEGTAEV